MHWDCCICLSCIVRSIQAKLGVMKLRAYLNFCHSFMNIKNKRNVMRLNRKPGFPEYGDSILASLSRVFVSRSPHVRLFTALVRPLLEYSSSVWNPSQVYLCIGGWRPSSGELLGVFQACVPFRIRNDLLIWIWTRWTMAQVCWPHPSLQVNSSFSSLAQSFHFFFFIEDPRSLFQNIASSC